MHKEDVIQPDASDQKFLEDVLGKAINKETRQEAEEILGANPDLYPI